MPHECVEKFTQRDLDQTMDLWEASLQFFPRDPDVQAEIMDALRNMVGCRGELVWIRQKISHQGKWQGFSQVREVFAFRFRPQDWSREDELVGLDGEMRRVLLGGAPVRQLPAPADPRTEAELQAAVERMVQKLKQPVRSQSPKPRKKTIAELRAIEAEVAAAAERKMTDEERERRAADIAAALAMRGKDVSL
jgi:hypothetical protein